MKLIIVTGYRHTGTRMMMQVLERMGAFIGTDAEKVANQRYEHDAIFKYAFGGGFDEERVTQMIQEFLTEANGQSIAAIKHPYLAEYIHKVKELHSDICIVYMERGFIVPSFAGQVDKETERKMKQDYDVARNAKKANFQANFKKKDYDIVEIDYNAFVLDPLPRCQLIAEETGLQVDANLEQWLQDNIYTNRISEYG